MLRQFLAITLLIVLLTAPSAFAGGANLYGPSTGAGTALSTATASSGMLLESGLHALWANPAGIISSHHEIYAEGLIHGAVTNQSQISPADWQAGVGMIGYLYSRVESAIALAYIPRERTELTADFGGGESVNRTSWSEATLTYAHELGRGIDIGVSAGALFGESRDGRLVSEADMDTVYKSLAWFGRIGIKQSLALFRWGLSLETPAFGTMTVEQPANVGYQRFDTDYDYSGAFGLRLGAGYDLRFAAIEADILYQATSAVSMGEVDPPPVGSPGTWNDGNLSDPQSLSSGDAPDVFSAGVAAKMQVDPRVTLHAGLRARFSDPVEISYLQTGLGGSYILNSELTLYAAVGALFPYGDGTTGTAWEDLRPFVLKGGIVFHNPAE